MGSGVDQNMRGCGFGERKGAIDLWLDHAPGDQRPHALLQIGEDQGLIRTPIEPSPVVAPRLDGT